MVLASTTSDNPLEIRPRALFNLSMLRTIAPQIPLWWITDQEVRSRNVYKYRRYQRGDHDANLTSQMAAMLRVDQTASSELAINYQDVIIQTKVDRCVLTGMTADNDAASKWSSELFECNRVDALQGDTHEASICDGDSYVMVYYDDDTGHSAFALEEAYDGFSGILAWYPRYNGPMGAAFKIWQEPDDKGWEITRVNAYYPDRVEKYTTQGGSFMPLIEENEEYDEDDSPSSGGSNVQYWVDQGEPIGIPIIHFPNGGRRNYGRSEIADAIAPQDILNRTLYSLVMASELTAFPIYRAFGIDPPRALTPGMIVSSAAPIQPGEQVVFDKLDGSDLAPYIALIEHLVGEIGKITRTPSPEFNSADHLSGESLKQREIGLLGKAERFITKAGNAWEDVWEMAWKIEQAFCIQKPPAYKTFKSVWKSAEIRNDKDLVDNIVAIKDIVGQKQTIHQLAEVFNYTQDDEVRILDEVTNESMTRFTNAAVNMFGNGNTPPANSPMNGNDQIMADMMNGNQMTNGNQSRGGIA